MFRKEESALHLGPRVNATGCHGQTTEWRVGRAGSQWHRLRTQIKPDLKQTRTWTCQSLYPEPTSGYESTKACIFSTSCTLLVGVGHCHHHHQGYFYRRNPDTKRVKTLDMYFTKAACTLFSRRNTPVLHLSSSSSSLRDQNPW